MRAPGESGPLLTRENFFSRKAWFWIHQSSGSPSLYRFLASAFAAQETILRREGGPSFFPKLFGNFRYALIEMYLAAFRASFLSIRRESSATARMTRRRKVGCFACIAPSLAPDSRWGYRISCSSQRYVSIDRVGCRCDADTQERFDVRANAWL